MHFKSVLAAAATLGVACAQQASQDLSQVPSDLSGGFKPDEVTLQVSFDGQSDNGIAAGAKESVEQTSQTPTFALGDSSGVNTEIKFVIFMVDTTDQNNRMLHYVQSDFQATGTKTAIQSNSKPQMPWMGPGTMGDSGANRQYTFLLYEQPNAFTGQGMPQMGQPVNVQDFVKANGLQKAVAGQTMVVDTGSGSSSGSGSTGNTGGSSGSNSQSSGQPSAVANPAQAPASGASTGQVQPALAANPTGSQSVVAGEGGVISSAPAPDMTNMPGMMSGMMSGSMMPGMSDMSGSMMSMTMSMPAGSAGAPSSGAPAQTSAPATGAGNSLSAKAWGAVVGTCVVAFGMGLVM